jgi:hypothetical protein
MEDLSKSAFDTASPYTFKFDKPERGKALYICPSWENNKGNKDPWGEIYKAVIPSKTRQGGIYRGFVTARESRRGRAGGRPRGKGKGVHDYGTGSETA